ncbi:peptide ABC transporter permease [Frondihabitans sp. PAMC 28766]|uniref:ABC transporter permease n=1 Tax=Frondihabitans sp. PAMC 28766 TaxID=1795630 RepID=UPI00078D5FDD|nr:ABC transporter permease [Frondihabitans sp. PAMC 28766]AMM20287.1 peptide ABC transporter permease [Frondihabitans sp. PAMC 28766]
MSLTPGELQVVAESDQNQLDTQSGKEPSIVGRSLYAIAWRRLRKDKVAMVAGIIIVLIVLIAIFADQLGSLYGTSYLTQHNTGSGSLLDPLTSMPLGSLGGVSAKHWFGVTPVLGQDILTLLMQGARTSLLIGSLATVVSLVFGVSLGLIAGYYRGFADVVISRIMDVLLSFPTLLLSISLITVIALISSSEVLRAGVIIFVLGFFGWPYIGRIVRGQVLSLREKEFVDAAKSLGASNGWIMAREIAPNLIGPILVYTTLTIPNNMLGEAGLSFLGVGVQPPTTSWGQMLSDAGNYYQIDPMYLILPGVAIFISVMAFNLFGDGLRDALDPRRMN